ncbi:MAG TPA: DoxX family protein, partial [Gemmataceae bacterium]|nr:DoxX family protein [Gemmataceae bacterium]
KERFDRWLADRDMYTGADLEKKDVAEWRKNLAAAEARRATAARLLPAFDGPKSADPKDALPRPHWRYEFVAPLLVAQIADADAESKALRANMQAELKSQSDAMRAQVGTPLLGEDRAKGYAVPVDEREFGFIPKSWGPIEYLDWTTRWFLTVVGALLMIGLFTRLSCFAGAGFLLLTILTQPSLPWLPTPPNQEGNYLIVSKNVIEMVALLALMTTRSGHWAGLDGLVSWMFGGRRRQTATRRPSRLVHSSNRT